jgi:hypothetical protein
MACRKTPAHNPYVMPMNQYSASAMQGHVLQKRQKAIAYARCFGSH